MMIDNLEFDGSKPWWCIMGGAQQIAYKMKDAIKQQGAVEFKKKVTKIEYSKDDIDEYTECVGVTVEGEKEPRMYHGVFNSATLGAQQQMDLDSLNLNYGTKQAIRSLGYGASCKVGIRFKRLWWREAPFNINRGGVGYTDRSIRACVYPSYNLYDPVDQEGALLASYTWSQEAERIGSLIARKQRGADFSSKDEAQLKALLINDLARLHADPTADDDAPNGYKTVLKIITDNYLDHYAYDWYADPVSVGAFAFFGPGQFRNMWQWITRTDGHYMIIGEASSSHHAWVVGALESAVRAVYQFLFRHSRHSKKADLALQAWVLPPGDKNGIRAPFGPVPHEFDRTKNLEYKDGRTPANASPFGELARHQVAFETIMNVQGGDQVQSKTITLQQLKEAGLILPKSS